MKMMFAPEGRNGTGTPQPEPMGIVRGSCREKSMLIFTNLYLRCR